MYGKLRVCERGFSAGKSEASKQAKNFVLAKTSNFLYTVLPFRCFFRVQIILLNSFLRFLYLSELGQQLIPQSFSVPIERVIPKFA